MKTPKRKLICPNCEEEIIIERYRDGSRDRLQFRCPSGCTLHRQDAFYHGNVREFYRLTRWIRKNREARLRRKIALLTKELERQKQIAKRQHQRDRERYEEIHKEWYELKRKCQELKKAKERKMNMTARELLQELQKLDEEELDRPVWLQYKDSTGIVKTDVAHEMEPTIWSTGEMTVTIRGEKAIWKGNRQ